MTKVRNWFTSRNMSWIKVIIFAIITGVVTAVLNRIPFLYDTSFQDIAISYECWILFAVFIIVNCKKWWEASLKTFLFFLISQPLIFLIESIFDGMNFAVFSYYKYWFFITLLTLPGAIIAYQLKRRDWISYLVLLVTNVGLAYISSTYFTSLRFKFPHHIISFVFCILLALFFTFMFLNVNWQKITAILVLIISLVVFIYISRPNTTQYINLPEGEWTYIVEDESIAKINSDDGINYEVTAQKEGHSQLLFTDSNGNIKDYEITVAAGSVIINEVE